MADKLHSTSLIFSSNIVDVNAPNPKVRLNQYRYLYSLNAYVLLKPGVTCKVKRAAEFILHLSHDEISQCGENTR